MTAVLRLGTDIRPLAVDRWLGAASDDELALLRTFDGPVIDLGCGPGRLVVALAEVGVPALGIDTSADAIRHARQRGAAVLRRSIFDPLPSEGRWKTALLFDGNVGIGGDPEALLWRARQIVAPDGVIVVEVDPPGSPSTVGRARLEHDGVTTPRFPWAYVSADVVDDYATTTGLVRARWWRVGRRWFAVLRAARR